MTEDFFSITVQKSMITKSKNFILYCRYFIFIYNLYDAFGLRYLIWDKFSCAEKFEVCHNKCYNK